MLFQHRLIKNDSVRLSLIEKVGKTWIYQQLLALY